MKPGGQGLGSQPISRRRSSSCSSSSRQQQTEGSRLQGPALPQAPEQHQSHNYAAKAATKQKFTFFLCATVATNLISTCLSHTCCACRLWWLFVSIGSVCFTCFGFNPLLFFVCHFSCAQLLPQTQLQQFWIRLVVCVGCGGYLFQLVVWFCLFCLF